MGTAVVIVVTVVLLGAAMTFRLWWPSLVGRLRVDGEVGDGLAFFFHLVLWLIAVAAVILVVLGLALDVISANFDWFAPEGTEADEHPMLAVFPLYEGTSWTYAYAEETEMGLETGVVTETVVTTEVVAAVPPQASDAVHVARMAVTGRKFLDRCPENGDGDGSTYWVVADRSRYYVVCSQGEVTSMTTALLQQQADGADEVLGHVPEFVLPLEEGRTWQSFPGQPVTEEGTGYRWIVESTQDARVPAGTFGDCYRMQLATLPDTTFRWVCPGVGVTLVEYVHWGSVHTYRAELIEYQVGAGE